MERWTERYPERFEHEVQAFRDTEGLDFELDEVELERSGRVVLHGTLARAGREPLELEVRYPDLFPFFRPEVFAPKEKFPRHQGLYRKNLCLLDRSTDQWLTENTGAWLVSERVSHLLDLLDGTAEAMRDAEAPQGEPLTTFLPFPPGGIVFIPGEIGDAAAGEQSGDITLSIGPPEEHSQGMRSCVSSLNADIRGGKVKQLASLSGPLKSRFPTHAVQGRWVRLVEMPEAHDGPSLLKAIRKAPGYKKPQAIVRPPSPNGFPTRSYWFGVVLQDEVEQGVWKDSWFFIVTHDKQEGRVTREEVLTIIRAEPMSPEDLAARIPTLTGLSQKVVAPVGLGALGGPLALELLRAQVGELRILDCDIVSGGTIVRWPLGLAAVGYPKTTLIRDVVHRDYPFTTVKTYDHRLGHVLGENEVETQPTSEVIDELLDGADLVIDATAEFGVRHFLSTLADERGIPQVYVSATQGGWGGVVARVIPGQTGCWWCLQSRLTEGTIKDAPFAPGATIQPRGCGSRTWIGTSFDALPLVAQAARVACFTLLAGRSKGASDVFVCDQEAASAAELAAPAWASYQLAPHRDCACSSESEQAAA